MGVGAAIPLTLQWRERSRPPAQPAPGRVAAALVKDGTPAYDSDDLSTVQQLLADHNRFAALEKLREFADGLSAMEVQGLLAKLGQPPITGPNREALHILLDRLLQLDPPGALAWAKSLTNPHDQRDALTHLFGTWASLGTGDALAALNQISNARLQIALRTTVLENMLESDPLAVLAEMQRQPRGLAVYANVFAAWASEDPQAAAAAVMAMPATRDGNHSILSVVQGWASVDAQSALAWAGTLPGGDMKNQAMAAAFSALVLQDPVAALDYTNGLPNGAAKRQQVQAALNVWGKDDPQAALAWIQQSSMGQSMQNAAIQNLLGPMSLVDLPGTLNYLAQMPEGTQRDQAIATVAKQGGGDPAGVLQWVHSLPYSDSNRVLMGTIVNNWANGDPDAASAFVESVPTDDPSFGKMLSALAMNRYTADPASAIVWAEALPADEGRGIAINEIAVHLATRDPAQAWALTTQQPETPKMDDTMVSVVTQWVKKNPDAATAAVQSANVSDTERQQLLNVVTGVGGTPAR
jgi:hypothetical protein